jgi:hypothetical protein
MQGYLQQWADNRATAQKQDFAYGIITLVWGVASLGTKVVKWFRSPKAADAVASTVDDAARGADELATGNTVLAGAGTVIDAGREVIDATNPSIHRWIDELGIDWDEWVKHYKFDYDAAEYALREAVALQRGWHPITNNAAGVINRLLVNGRSALAGRGGQIDPNDVAQLGEWASHGGFWDGLLTVAADMGDGIGLFYNADDVRFLKAVLEGGGEVGAIRTAIGPAQNTALQVAADVVSDVPTLADLAIDGGKVGFNTGNVANSAINLGGGSGSPAGQHIDLGSYTDQFGGWASRLDDGIGWFMLHGAWGIFTSPFEWFSSIAHTAGSMDRYNEFLEGSGDDLVELGAALNGAIDALNDMQGTIDRADLDDPTSALGGARAGALRDLVDDMNELLDGASPEWLDENGDEVRGRIEHIEQKIADVERMLDVFEEHAERLAHFAEALDRYRRNDDGSLRDVMELFDPELLVWLGAGELGTRGMIGSAMQGGTEPYKPPPIPEDSYMDGFEDSEWEAELDEIFSE